MLGMSGLLLMEEGKRMEKAFPKVQKPEWPECQQIHWFACLIYLINGLVQGEVGRNGFKQTWCYIYLVII